MSESGYNRSDDAAALHILDNLPSIGFFNTKKRFAAFQWMSQQLDEHRLNKGDYITVFCLVISRSKSARKALDAACFYHVRGLIFPAHLHQAGHDYLNIIAGHTKDMDVLLHIMNPKKRKGL